MQTHLEIENFLPKTLEDLTEQNMTNLDKWVYCDQAVELTPQVKQQIKYLSNVVPSTSQFSHHCYTREHGWNEDLQGCCEPILWILQDEYKFKIDELIRIKANITTQHNMTEKQYCTPHADVDQRGYTSILYYANDSDGDTRLFDTLWNSPRPENMRPIYKSSPKKGKAIIFDSDRFHSASLPIECKNRMVINFCFKANRKLF